MRLLADANVSGDTVRLLRMRGHDVVWVRTDAPRMKDPEILAWATREDRVLLTHDKDFGELAVRLGQPAAAGIILIRLTLRSPERTAMMIADALETREDWAGHFAVIEDDRIRMFRLPVIPALKLTDRWLVDVNRFEIIA